MAPLGIFYIPDRTKIKHFHINDLELQRNDSYDDAEDNSDGDDDDHDDNDDDDNDDDDNDDNDNDDDNDEDDNQEEDIYDNHPDEHHQQTQLLSN